MLQQTAHRFKQRHLLPDGIQGPRSTRQSNHVSMVPLSVFQLDHGVSDRIDD